MGRRPRTGAELGRRAEGVVYENLDDPGWVVKVFFHGVTSPLQANNEFINFAVAPAVRPHNVVDALAPLDPRQGWLVKERVIPSASAPDLLEKMNVLCDLQNVPDADSNLLWGATAGDTTPRWILIE